MGDWSTIVEILKGYSTLNSPRLDFLSTIVEILKGYSTLPLPGVPVKSTIVEILKGYSTPISSFILIKCRISFNFIILFVTFPQFIFE